jgi:hydroxyacylglutathione hydrolase
MADREFTTLGYERLHNPAFQYTGKEAFIRYKVAEHHYQPPYFRTMERLNKEGAAPPSAGGQVPAPLDADAFAAAMQDGMTVIDVRSAEAFAGAFVADSLAIPLNMVPSYAGWFLSYERPLGIIADRYEDAARACTYLMRLGYDRVHGYLENGLTAWEVSGRTYDRIPAVHAAEMVARSQDPGEAVTLLDVRKREEVAAGRLPRAQHIFLGELPRRLDEIAKDRPVITFCGSGQRAVIAASILKMNGFARVENSLGSMAACAAVGCPIET